MASFLWRLHDHNTIILTATIIFMSFILSVQKVEFGSLIKIFLSHNAPCKEGWCWNFLLRCRILILTYRNISLYCRQKATTPGLLSNMIGQVMSSADQPSLTATSLAADVTSHSQQVCSHHSLLCRNTFCYRSVGLWSPPPPASGLLRH